MVSWWSDGLVSGYLASGESPSDGVYHLASGGDVDAQGITRLQYALGSPYMDYVHVVANISYTAADAAAHPGTQMGATMFVIPAYYFPPNAVPTPQAILDLGPVLRSFRSSNSVHSSGGASANNSFSIVGPRAATLQPNTKYWFLVVPTAWVSGTPSNYANDAPVDPTAPYTARGISLWTNRTPTKPIITSPVSGTVNNSGVSLALSFTAEDPDAISGSTDTSYLDLAGVQVQYAAKPTLDNPNPSWQDLPWGGTDGATVTKGWYIDGAATNTSKDGIQTLWTTQSSQIMCGSNNVVAGQALLPSGDWQIRLRTFDYGHPYPGIWRPLASKTGNYTPSNFPAVNTSPWSDPVVVSVTAQVPPPIPLSPIDDNALIEGSQITLNWLYRNTFNPPYAQAKRSVRIKKVTDTAWTNLLTNDASAASSYTLPPYVPGVSGNLLYHDDGSATTGWSTAIGYGSAGSTAITEVGGAVNIAVTNTNNASAPNETEVQAKKAFPAFTAEQNPNGLTVQIKGHYHGYPSSGDGAQTQCVTSVFPAGWAYDSAHSSSPANPGNNTLVDGDYVWTMTLPAGTASPAGTAMAQAFFANYSGSDQYFTVDDVAVYPTDQGRIDPVASSGIDMPATTEYQWQVQVTDADNVVSNWSDVASFWIVPPPSSGGSSPIPADTIEGATLGCGTHRVFIYRRGGTTRVGEIRNISHVDWSRVRDDMSTAQIVVSGWDIDCGNLLAKLQCWAYEVVIFRDNGFGVDRVWEGPITLLTYEVDKVTIDAKDIFAYPYRRIIKQDMNDNVNGDTVTSRAARILQNVMAPDDPNVLAYLQVLSSSDDAMEYRSLPQYSKTAYEEIDDMAANAGLDYTVVGRTILLWGTKHHIGKLPEFRDKDLGSPPIVSEYGMSMANRYVVTDGNGVWGEATRNLDPVSGNDPVYGLVEMVSSSWSSTDDTTDTTGLDPTQLAKTQQSYADSAETSISDRYPSPVVVRVPDSTSLNPEAVVSINQLVPGVSIPLRSTGTLRAVYATQKLDSIKVTEENGRETITVSMSPFTTDETLAAEEESDSGE